LKKGGLLLADIMIHPELDDFFQGRNLGQAGPHLPVSGKGHGRFSRRLPCPPAQHALHHVEVEHGLSHRHTSIRHKPDGFNLEIMRKLLARHIHSPVPWS
jgi:hypothetical protein